MKRLLKIIGVLLALFVIAFIGFFFWAKSATLPKSDYNTLYHSIVKPESRNDSTLRVAVYNIGYLSGMANNLPQRPTRDFYAHNEQRVVPALRSANADIIGFQEIDYNSKRSYGVNQAQLIADSLAMYGAFAVNWDKRYVPFPNWPLSVQFGKVVSGQAIMSKYPLSDAQAIQLEKVKSNPFYYNAFYLDRLAQVVTVEHPVRPIKVINLHAEAFDTATRRKHLQYVYDLFWELEKEYPVILMGDFNSDPGYPNAEIDLFLNDPRFSIAAFDRKNSGGSPKTYPSVNANERLDYIFVHSARFEIIDSRILNEFTDISDHLPCWAVLKMR